MREDFRKYYQRETIYVNTPDNVPIPNLVHQIWIGSKIPSWRKIINF